MSFGIVLLEPISYEKFFLIRSKNTNGICLLLFDDYFANPIEAIYRPL
jgi:hypothetical protein